VAPLAAATTYSFQLEVQGTELPGAVTTASGPDRIAPTPPAILGHFAASDPNRYSACVTNRVELLSLRASTDDATQANDLRYSVSRLLPTGSLERSYSELSLFDGGLLALPYGLQGLPGSYVAQARDWAGNLSPPSNAEAIDIGPGCSCAGRTTGPGPVSRLGLLGAGLWWLQRRRVGRRPP
jgi:uncharacterized protein (TIGR03382 family)